jgi:hypothetical protein
LPDAVLRAYLGGAGLGTWLLHRLWPPGVEPLAPRAPLAFVFSPLVGTPLTTSAKFALVAKSPLTGLLTDALASSQVAISGKLIGHDVIIVAAGSSVGTRDETANAVAALGPPGIWCHGLAIKPGKPTLLAECGTGTDGTPGIPVIGRVTPALPSSRTG